MSKRIKGITIVLGADKTAVDRALKEIESVSRGLNKELRDVNNLLRFSPDNTQLVTQKQRMLADQVKATREKLDQLRAAEQQVAEQFKSGEIGQQQYDAFQREIIETESKLRHYEKQLKETGNQQIIFGQQLQEAGERMKKAGDKMQEVGRNLSMKVTAPILAIGTVGVKAAMDFETGMAGVRKTTDLTAAELETMGQSLRDMAKEIPVSVVELTNLAETAGQLGIEKEHLVDFTRTVADLSVATNILGQEGATNMARFANIMQMSQKDFDRMGSAIVDLGNNTATTEKEILEMGMRLAGAGKQANMTEADVLGIAAGLSALGLEAQAGGTAFSRVVNRIQLDVDTGSDDLIGFAQVAGMSASDFAQAWEDDAAGALAMFITGLADTTKHGKTTNEMLDELGINEIRVSDALRRTSGANELFNKTLKLSNEAWEENTALQKEASIRYETTESKMQLAKNQLNDAAIDLGQKLIPTVMKLVEFITDLVTGFSKLSPATQDTIIKIGLFAAALGPVVSTVGKVVSGVGNITSGFGKMMEAAGKGTGVLGSLVDKLGGVGPTALVGAAAAATVALGFTIAKMWEVDPALKEAKRAMAEAGESAEEATLSFISQSDQIDRLQEELFELADKSDKTTLEKERMAVIVERLNKLMPDLNLEYEKETDQLNMTKKAIREVTTATKERILEETKAKIIADYLEAQAKIMEDIAKKNRDAIELAKQQERIEAEIHKARKTGLTDYEIMMATTSKAEQEMIGWSKVLSAEQEAAIQSVIEAMRIARGEIADTTDVYHLGWSNAILVTNDIGTEIGSLQGVMGELENVLKSGEKEHISYIDSLDDLGREFLGLSKISEETADQIEEDEDRKATAAEDAADREMTAKKNLQDAAEKHKNAMSGFTKERFDYEKGTTAEFLKLWEDELVAFENWHTNLQIIASKVGPDVAEELEKLGPEAAPLIQKFVDGSDEDLAKLRGVVERRTQAAVAQAKLELGNLYGEGHSGGRDLMFGMSSGIDVYARQAGISAAKAAKLVAGQIRAELKMRSPSQVAIEIGRNLVESLGLGMDQGEDDLARTAKGLGQTMVDALTLPDLPRDNVIDGRAAFAGMDRAVAATVSGGDIIIQSMTVRDDSDIRKIAQELYSLQAGQKRGRGMVQ